MNKEVEEAKGRLKESLDNIFSCLLYSQENKDKDIKTLLNYIQELEDEIYDLKEIEKAHQEENGNLRQENYELTAKVTDNICKGVEEKVLEEYRQKIEKLEEDNKRLKNKCLDMATGKTYVENETIKELKEFIKDECIQKQIIQNRIKELTELFADPLCAENVHYRLYELERLLGKVD